MPNNTFEFRDGDCSLTLDVDKLDSLPLKNLRLCLRILRGHPEDIKRLESALQQSLEQAKEDWRDASNAFVNGWKDADKQSKRKEAIETRKQNTQLKSNLKRAKTRFDNINKRISIIQNF